MLLYKEIAAKNRAAISLYLCIEYLRANRAHREAVAAAAVVVVVAAPVVAAAAEAMAVSVVAVVAVQRTRPIVAAGAAGAMADGSRTDAVARSGQEYAVAVGAGYAVTVNTVKGCPLPSALAYEFFLFFYGRHSPTAAPFNGGDIVCGFKGGFVIHSAITAACAVFGH